MASLKQIVHRAETEPQFRERLKADPAGVLQAGGIDVPANLRIEVIENQADELHLFVGGQSNLPGIARVLERAGKDSAFKQRLQSSPRAVLEEATGEKLPEHIKVRLHEPAADRLRLLVRVPPQTDGELSDAELESVAGGGLLRNLVNRIVDGICPNTTLQITTAENSTGDRKKGFDIVDYSATQNVNAVAF